MKAIASPLRPGLSEVRAAWKTLVSSYQEQIARLNETPEQEGEAFWTNRVPIFRPGALKSEELDYIRSLAQSDDVWMDIGAGAGRLAVPLSKAVKRIVAIDTSPTMRSALAEAIRQGHSNIEIFDARWPDAAESLPTVDVALAANMLYQSEDPVPFIEAMERHARRLCVFALSDRPPRAPDPAVWEDLYGEPLVLLPGAQELAALLAAMDRRFNLITFDAPPRPAAPLDAVIERERARYGLKKEAPELPRLRELLVHHFGHTDGSVQIRSGRRYIAVITWSPRK